MDFFSFFGKFFLKKRIAYNCFIKKFFVLLCMLPEALVMLQVRFCKKIFTT